jgi:hypothetical protein
VLFRLLHRILPIFAPAVDPTWQVEVSPVCSGLRELVSFSSLFKLAAVDGDTTSNAPPIVIWGDCPHGCNVDGMLVIRQVVTLSGEPWCLRDNPK